MRSHRTCSTFERDDGTPRCPHGAPFIGVSCQLSSSQWKIFSAGRPPQSRVRSAAARTVQWGLAPRRGARLRTPARQPTSAGI